MLRALVIKNVAIAEHLEVFFGSGLNVITGETGAGKSIFVHSLTALATGRLDPDGFFVGKDQATICSTFELDLSHPLLRHFPSFFEEADRSDTSKVTLLIKRQFFKNSRTKSYVNDEPVTHKTVQLLMKELVDINSQFDHQNLLDMNKHMSYLVRHGHLEAKAQTLSEVFQNLESLLKNWVQCTSALEREKRERELNHFELSLIESAGVSSEEWDAIKDRIKKSQVSKGVLQSCQSILGLLRDSEESCLNLLTRSKKQMDKLTKHPSFSQLISDLRDFQGKTLFESSLSSLDSDIQGVESIARQFTFDSSEQDSLLEREVIYQKLLARFGSTVDEVLAYAQTLRQKLSAFDEITQKKSLLSQEFRSTLNQFQAAAQEFKVAVESAIRPLEQEIGQELSALGMPHTRFHCRLFPSTPSLEVPSELCEAGVISGIQPLHRGGWLGCEFMLQSNPGHPPVSLNRGASGGELSRIMLALKTVLMSFESLSVFVFDEIDSGLSGRVASIVGKKLVQFCRHKQAICITHLPQVACFAGNHYIVSKSVANGVTKSSILQADLHQREEELAKMLSGETLTPESFAQAKKLLDLAQKEGSP